MLRCVVPDVVTNQDLLTLPATATVEEAARRMTERRVRSVLVVEDERLIGIFTGTDLIERVVATGVNARVTCIGEVMSADPQTIGPDVPAIEALRMMQACGFRHLPVLHEGRLVAVLSRRDFAREEEQELEREERLWEEM
ncbi:CBS domain-containing protein [Nisaea sediminum]|uniref:CBS domain-containing protein n=1 Tax=Nisaea sediminum TaxID=2775867 RepID=UPI00186877A6|nr:CBS domain-containing protein [Nisaea sediminum]